MPPDHARAAAHADGLEQELRRLGWWQAEPPTPEKLQFTAAFGADTLAFPQWLQWVLLARVRQIVAEGGTFPDRSEVAAYAVRELDGVPEAADLLELLQRFDAFIEAGAAGEVERPPTFPADFEQAVAAFRDTELARERGLVTEALGKPVVFDIDWTSLGGDLEALTGLGRQGLAPVRAAVLLLRDDEKAAVAPALDRVTLRRVASPAEAACVLEGGTLRLAIRTRRTIVRRVGGEERTSYDHGTAFSADDIQRVLRDTLDLEKGPGVRRLRDVGIPELEDEVRRDLRLDVRVEADWAGLLALSSDDCLRALRRLEDDHLRHLGYLLRGAAEQVPLAPVRGIRYEHREDPAEREVLADGDRLVIRQNLTGADGGFSTSDLETILPGVVAGMPWPAAPAGAGGPDEFPRLVDDYRSRILPAETTRLHALLGEAIPVEVAWAGLRGQVGAARGLARCGLGRVVGALAFLGRDPDLRAELPQKLVRVSLRFVDAEARACVLADSALDLAVSPAAGMDAGGFYEHEIARVVKEGLGVDLREPLVHLRADAATWEARLREALGVAVVYDVDWRGFTAHPEMGRNRFALHLLGEHGIDALYYALSGLAEDDDALRASVARRLRRLRLESVGQARAKGLSADGDALVLRLFLHEGYEGYLTIDELQERIPPLLRRMPLVPEAPAPVGARATPPPEAPERPATPEPAAETPTADEWREVIEQLEHQVLPAWAAQTQALLGSSVAFAVDWASLEGDEVALNALLSSGLGHVLGALVTLAQSGHRAALAAQVQRVRVRRVAPPAPRACRLAGGELQLDVTPDRGDAGFYTMEELVATLGAALGGAAPRPARPAAKGPAGKRAAKKPAKPPRKKR